MSEAMRHVKYLEAPNEHPLNPQECFGCGRTFDSGEDGYTGIASCFCGICLASAIDKAPPVGRSTKMPPKRDGGSKQ